MWACAGERIIGYAGAIANGCVLCFVSLVEGSWVLEEAPPAYEDGGLEEKEGCLDAC
jgi:hypothetical protein